MIYPLKVLCASLKLLIIMSEWLLSMSITVLQSPIKVCLKILLDEVSQYKQISISAIVCETAQRHGNENAREAPRSHKWRRLRQTLPFYIVDSRQ